jgi:hypothetical protein
MTPTNTNQPPARKGPAGTPGTINDYNHQPNLMSTTLLLNEKPSQKSENKTPIKMYRIS